MPRPHSNDSRKTRDKKVNRRGVTNLKFLVTDTSKRRFRFRRRQHNREPCRLRLSEETEVSCKTPSRLEPAVINSLCSFRVANPTSSVNPVKGYYRQRHHIALLGVATSASEVFASARSIVLRSNRHRTSPQIFPG